MTWITDALERQRREAEQAAALAKNLLAIKQKLDQQLPSAWDRIAEAIKGDVAQLNAAGGHWVADCGSTMIVVHRENEITALFTLEIDSTTGTIRYNCPVPAGKAGVPLTGKLQMRVGPGEAHVVGRRYPNGRGPVVQFTPERISQLLFSATLFPANPPRF